MQWCDQGAQVRMQAEGAGEKPRYRNTLAGFVTIARTEGIRGLYKVPFMQYSVQCVIAGFLTVERVWAWAGSRANNPTCMYIIGGYDVLL